MSDPVEIPVAEDTPLYSERITLDGRDFLFEFDWSDREGRWYLSIRSVNEEPLAMGIKIVANWPLLHRRSDPALPQGNLFAADTSPERGESPTFLELGKRVKLLYFPPG